MRIVICATSFLPRVGGIENIADMMAHALAAGGDDVTVLTMYDGPPMPERAYTLIRNPGAATVFRICRGADAVIMPNMGMKLAVPAIASRAPLFIWHQHQYRVAGLPDRKQTLPTQIKGFAIKRLVTANLGCSDFITRHLPTLRPRATLLNPYDADMFYEDASVERDRDILALGRLVEEKGFQTVLQAMALPDSPLGTARLAIVGEGPGEGMLREMTSALGLADRVSFPGVHRGDALRRLLNQHRVLVVPSVWQEPFGIVALEGLACGCATVVSEVGGLPQAVGGQGATFEPGNAVDAARVLAAALTGPRDPDPAARRAHLANHSCDAVANELRRLIMEYSGT